MLCARSRARFDNVLRWCSLGIIIENVLINYISIKIC